MSGEDMAPLIDEFLTAAYGEQEARRIAGSYRLAATAAALKRDHDARAAAERPAPTTEGG